MIKLMVFVKKRSDMTRMLLKNVNTSRCDGRMSDGTITPLTLPIHASLKSSTLRAICTQAQMPRDEFLRAYYRG
jgi:hypothetical protein